MKSRPSLKEVKDFINSPDLYTGKDDERLLQKKFLINATTVATDSRTLTGSLTYIAETIGKTYKHISPIKQKRWFGFGPTTGSELYTNIENQLIKFDKASDDERFINLMKFYKRIQSLPGGDVEELFNKTKEDLLLNIESRLRRVRKRENTRIAIITHSLPDLVLLQNRLKKLIPDYQNATKSRWYSNANRLRLLEFNRFIIETWQIYKAKQEEIKKVEYANLKPEELEKRRTSDYEKAGDILTGNILYILLRINTEYACLSPERSKLFIKSLKLMNKKSLNDITAEKKEKKLRAIAAYLQEIKNDEAYAELINQAKKIFDLDKYILKIDEYIVEEEKNKRTSTATRHIATALNYATQYGISYTLTAIGGAIITGATGPIGAIVYGVYTAAGTVLMTKLGQLVHDHFIPPAVSKLYTLMLERIGDGIATITIGAAEKTYHALFNHKNLSEEDRDFIKEWIISLLEAPDSVVPEEEKEEIRYVIGPDMLASLQETIPVAAFKNR